jgi:hypothetical protein
MFSRGIRHSMHFLPYDLTTYAGRDSNRGRRFCIWHRGRTAASIRPKEGAPAKSVIHANARDVLAEVAPSGKNAQRPGARDGRAADGAFSEIDVEILRFHRPVVCKHSRA